MIAALLAVPLLAGCTPDAEPANALDASRRAALLEVLWFVPVGSNDGGPAVTGADRPYERPGASWYETRPGTPAEAVRTEIDKARAAGWVTIYGRCDEGIVVHLSRDLPDGSPTYAELIASGRDAAGDDDGAKLGEGARVRVLVDAHTLYHLDTLSPEPVEEVDVESLVCLDDRGGGIAIGAEMPVDAEGHVDRPEDG